MTRFVLALALCLPACSPTAEDPEPTDTGDDTANQDSGDTGDTATDPCDAVTCDHGVCVAEDGVGTCDCDAGWEGASCEDLIPPPSQGLVLWLDANDPLNNGTMPAEISVWVDRSGQTANLIAPSGREPSTVASGDLTVASFDGAGDFLVAEDFDHLTDVAHYTVIVVGKARGLGQSFVGGAEAVADGKPGLVLETVSGSNAHFAHRSPFGDSGGDEVSTSSGPLAADTLHRLWAVRSIASNTMPEVVLYADDELGAVMSTGSATDYASALDFVVGAADPSGNGLLNGEIGEILVYVGARTPTSNPEIETYLQERWGVQ
ncbi:MAG: hypothetical protein EP330_09990 [Deltaproteobacteria bacterium]|nr:MAG: hypothetical protein EP330_09990 [Deltaproteobacteria bacterium]